MWDPILQRWAPLRAFWRREHVDVRWTCANNEVELHVSGWPVPLPAPYIIVLSSDDASVAHAKQVAPNDASVAFAVRGAQFAPGQRLRFRMKQVWTPASPGVDRGVEFVVATPASVPDHQAIVAALAHQAPDSSAPTSSCRFLCLCLLVAWLMSVATTRAPPVEMA